MDLPSSTWKGLRALVACAALTALAAHAQQAPEADPAADRLTCHGEPREPSISHADACTQAEQARMLGDHLALYRAVEIMRQHDPGRAQPCTSRHDDVLAGVDVRERGDYRAGLAAMKAGALERARACFRLAVAEDPYNQVAARRLGEVEAAIARQVVEAEVAAPEADPGPPPE